MDALFSVPHLNRHLDSGMAIAMERKSPKIWYHLSMFILFYVVEIADKISLKWYSMCGCSYMVVFITTITHPIITWYIDQVQLPVTIFL